jgi:hypothetical protein
MTVSARSSGQIGRKSMFRTVVEAIGFSAPALIFVLAAIGTAGAQDIKAQYPAMAPLEQYRIANLPDEIALARSAAPASISTDARVLVLGSRGYETAARGKNGFDCIVERSWATDLDDPEFWNPKIRAPICFNAPAARSVLSQYLQRTEWVLAGLSKPQILDRIKSALATKRFSVPEPAAMCYMMSMHGYLGDAAGHWLPHLMFFLPRTDASAWGGNLPGSPVVVHQGSPEPVTVFLIPVRNWSDGSPALTDRPM